MLRYRVEYLKAPVGHSGIQAQNYGRCVADIYSEGGSAEDAVRIASTRLVRVRVCDIMRRQLITVGPEHSIEPVGMLSMRDLAGQVLSEKEYVIDQMTYYISGALVAPDNR